MCGIFFVLNNESNKQSKIAAFLRDAFITSQVRGVDGSGMAVIGGKTPVEKKHPFFFKTMINGSGFIEQGEVKGGISRAGDAVAALCHVRAATHGKVSAANSHPFRVLREDGSWIIGVHNGTLAGWERGPDAKDFEVDSEWALRMIANHGADAFEYFTGSFAFVWYDSLHPDKVYMARNDRRTLNFLVDESRKVMYGATEAGMLGWLAERNNITPAKDNKGSHEMYFLMPDHLYTFDLNNIGKYTAESLPKYNYQKLYPPTATTTTDYTPAPASSSSYSNRMSDWEYAEDFRDPLGVYGGHWNAGAVRRRFARTSEQDVILAEMKSALSKARAEQFAKDAADIDSPVIDGAELDTRLYNAIQKSIETYAQASLSDEQITISDPIFVHSPLDNAANRGEIKAAREKNIYGQIVSFVPSLYDATSQSLLGEFTVVMRKDKHVVLGELRHDITTAKANDLINQGKPILVAVVGMSNEPVRGGDEDDLGDYTYVVANLTADQRSLVRDKISGHLH